MLLSDNASPPETLNRDPESVVLLPPPPVESGLHGGVGLSESPQGSPLMLDDFGFISHISVVS